MSRNAVSFIVALAITVVVGAPRDASAQVVPTQIYDDAKAVVEELIEKDVARNVAPNVACQAPITLLYFRSTLQRIYDRQFGALDTAIQSDTATIAGSFVYFAVHEKESPSHSPVPVSALLREFVKSEGKVAAADVATLATIASVKGQSCADAIRATGGPFFYWADKSAALLDRSCKPGSPSLACALGIATKDFISGDTTGGEAQVRMALAIAFGAHNLAGATPADVEAIASMFQEYFAAFAANPTASPLTFVTEPKLKEKLTSLVSRVERLARQWEMATNGGKSAFSPVALIRFIATAADAEALCPDEKGCGVLRALVSAGATDINLILEAAGNKPDVETIAVDVFRAIFVTPQNPDCTRSPTMAMAATPPKYDLVKQRNIEPKPATSDNASAAAAPDHAEAPADCDTQVTIDRYGVFLAALASYTVELAKNGNANADTRAAFQNAALDIIQTEGPRTGLERTFWSSFVVPKPSLRFSWSPGYVNETTHDGLRYLVTLDWPTLVVPLRHTQQTYLAIGLSFLDLLGPFSETALRKQAQYKDAAVDWYGFINPRAELMYGIPMFTTHLALVGAVSYRGAAAAKLGADGSTLKYFSPYQTAIDAAFPADYTGGRAAYYSQFIETSVGVKYLP